MSKYEVVYMLVCLPVILGCPAVLWALGIPTAALIAEALVSGFCFGYGYMLVREGK